MTSRNHGDDFRSLLLEISNQITQEDLGKQKFLCQDKIDRGRLEQIRSAHELYQELINTGNLSENDTRFLQDLLAEPRLKEKVQNFQYVQGPSNPNSREPVQLHPGFPCEVRHFTGRNGEVTDIINAIIDKNAQLLILKSPPGFGKSAVAKQVGHTAYRKHNMVVVFVCLRQYTSLACACTAILRAVEGHDVKLSDDVIMQTQKRLTTLNKTTLLILDNTEDLQCSKSGTEFAKFVEFLGNHSKALHLFLTSRQDMREVSFHYDRNLEPLEAESAAELLVAMTRDSRQSLSHDDAKELAIQCRRIPLLLEMAAKLLNVFQPHDLAQSLKDNLHGVLTQIDVVHKSIAFFLQSFHKDKIVSLIKLSNFSASFTVEYAKFFFKDSTACGIHLSELYANALIQKEDSQSYSLHPVIQTFCREEQLNLGCAEEGKLAEEAYNNHFLQMLEQIHKAFVSTNCKEALCRFYRVNMDIKQAYKNCLEKGTVEMKKECIRVFNNTINFLGKVLQPQQCCDMYKRLHSVAVNLDDERLASECLVSLGFRYMCDGGHRQFSPDAFEAFTTAYNILRKLPKRQRKTELFAHCCSKLGLCNIWKGDRQRGKRLIDGAFDIRKEIGDQVLIGASFCDKAIAARICGENGQSINFLIEHCLPLYTEHLGDHPWMATIHSYISDVHADLGNDEAAITHRKLSIDIRESLLGHHQDTARGYTKLGEMFMAHPNMRRREEARDVFMKALKIQEDVLGNHPETIATRKALAEVLEQLGATEEACCMRERVVSGEKSHRETLMQQRQISEIINEKTRAIAASKSLDKRWVVMVSPVLVLVAIVLFYVINR